MVKTEDLKRINMLKDVPDHLLDIIGREANLNIFGANTQLFEIGDSIDTFYMMIMGQVALKMSLTEDIDVILDNLQAGRTFGSSSLIEGSKATYTAVCQEPCEVITLSGARMLELFEINKELAYFFMVGVAGQYKRNMERRARMIMETLEDYPDLKQGIQDISHLTPSF